MARRRCLPKNRIVEIGSLDSIARARGLITMAHAVKIKATPRTIVIGLARSVPTEAYFISKIHFVGDCAP